MMAVFRIFYINVMERRSIEIDKPSSGIKLPAIQQRKGDSSRILSSTMP